ncbi:TetR/AcrR family transcriptional regulator [Rhodococcus fascians]|nr:TetR/AcrR family transcriptional regulator [Rhodococcus fascians]MBY4429585.1 TetR/AcrR family transcriptional regulator [Rhodococcus fascians]
MSDVLDVSDGRLARGNRTREQLLESALKLFGERGFYATTMKDLAKDAGVSPPAVYNHFDSKESVLFAALIWGLQRFKTFVIDVDDTELASLERLEGVVKRHTRNQIMFSGRARFVDRLLDAVSAGELLDPPRRDAITRMRVAYQQLVDGLIADVTQNSSRSMPPVHVCRAAILNLCDRSPQWVQLGKNVVSTEDVEEDVWFLVRGMLGVERA